MKHPAGDSRLNDELAGFFLPGFLHEVRNLLNRIGLLTEIPDDSSPLAMIRSETRSKEFRFVCDLARAVSAPREEHDEEYGRPSEVGRIELPADLDPLFRVLRSSARSAGIALTVEEIASVAIYGDKVGMALSIAQQVCRACSGSPKPHGISVTAAAAEDGAQLIFRLRPDVGPVITFDA